MSLKFQSRILDHLRHDRYEPGPVERLAADLDIDADEMTEFRDAIKRMTGEGLLDAGSDAKIRLPAMGDEVEGVFRKNARGFGFLVPTRPFREGDLFIPPEETSDALTGDVVVAEVVRGFRRGEQDTTGRITQVVRRKRTSFSGELTRRGGLWVVFPDGKELTGPITVRDADSKNAREKDKVVVEITAYPEGDLVAEGVIVRVLGEAGLPDVETQATIAAYDLPGDFPEACIAQARDAARRFDEEVAQVERTGNFSDGRLDLRSDFIITIDPPDAKDYDDAISIRRLDDRERGPLWELGVHIADVAHFIAPGTPLDEEAEDRGNSTYLPRLVLPMLPEVLSNGICSLQEGVVRFCKSAFMRYDAKGRVVKEWTAATAIKSAKRLTYLEAQALIDGDLKEAVKHARTEPKYTDQLIETLREMNRCARAIQQRRRSDGMIHLDLPEAVLVFDELGHVVDAVPEDDAYTHTLIEMFMVEANEVVARLFESLRVPLIRRIHPEPAPGDVQELQMTASVAGYKIPRKPTRQDLQALLDATTGTGAARAVHMAVLRTLTKAEYSPAQIGHFALASKAYAHFTSPIRRYADTTVHRALTEYLRRTDNGRTAPQTPKERHALGARLLESPMCPDEDALVTIAAHITQTEQNAEGAEQNLRQFLLLQLLNKYVNTGDTFDGCITGVSPSGVFVQLDKYLADGMIKASDLPTGGQAWTVGRWRVDQRTGALVHDRTGRSFNIGDKVTVQISAIDLALRRMDLTIHDARSRSAGKSKKLPDGGLKGGGLGDLDWDRIKHGQSGATARSKRSKQRESGKQDFRKERKDRGKR